MSLFSRDKRKIVILDDEESVRYSVSAYFKRKGFDTHAVSTSTELMNFLEGNQPDVILLDIHLDTENGIESIPAIKQAAPQAMLMILTVDEYDRNMLQKCLAKGAAGYINKAIGLTGMHDMVMEALLREDQT